MPKLVHTINGAIFEQYPLEAGQLRIGRDDGNDISLDDDAVSGRHVDIVVKPSRYLDGLVDVWAKDVGSTNGTLVNGKRIKKHLLTHNDVLKVGTCEFKFVDENGAAAARTTRILIDED